MKLIRKGNRPTHRGVIGIEAAIVLIAFVIVAAALAFVVLNMGFTTTQKAKTAIVAALEEAGSSMQVTGKITATGDVANVRLNTTNLPIKIVSGGASANLDGNVTSVKFIGSNLEYDNIYDNGPISIGQFRNATFAWNQAQAMSWIGPGEHPITENGPSQTTAIIYWTVNLNNNTILDIGENVVLSVAYAANERPKTLEKIAIEIFVPEGAPLTVDRTVAEVTSKVVDLG
jgi:archaeal flagellin FlaB